MNGQCHRKAYSMLLHHFPWVLFSFYKSTNWKCLRFFNIQHCEQCQWKWRGFSSTHPAPFCLLPHRSFTAQVLYASVWFIIYFLFSSCMFKLTVIARIWRMTSKNLSLLLKRAGFALWSIIIILKRVDSVTCKRMPSQN